MNELHATGHCPICRTAIPALAPGHVAADGDVPPQQCVRCATWYHADCWDYGGGCAIFGCAPAQPSRPCPVPRAPLTLGEQVVDSGLRLALGTLLWLLGSMLGVLGWFLIGPLLIPILVALTWFADPAAPGGGTGRLLRLGALFGPPALAMLPLQIVIPLLIPFGLAVAGLGQLMRLCAGFPRLAFSAVFGVTALLSWSHAPDQVPLPYARLTVERSALPAASWLRTPYLIQPASLGRWWDRARVPEDARVLVFPHGAREVQVALVRGRVRVTFESGDRRYPSAAMLPAGDDPVELVERDTWRAVLGPRLDDLIHRRAVPAETWNP